MIPTEFKKHCEGAARTMLAKELSLSNMHEVPKLTKIVLNAGVKGAGQDAKVMNYVYEGMTAIAGQKPMKTKAKKSIAGFKIRENVHIGCMVTLRGKAMYSFLEKLTKVVIPAIRDFRGLPKKVDQQGNYNLGLKDWSVFPEINFDRFPNAHGLNITFCIQGGVKKGFSQALLKSLGILFVEEDNKNRGL